MVVSDLFSSKTSEPVEMKNLTSTTLFALAAATVMMMAPRAAQAQCTTCVTPQVAYSPVVYNNYAYEGWYLGKYLGRATRGLFGVAPAAAYQAGYPATYATPYAAPATYAAAYPRTYGVGFRRAHTVGYAPAYSYAVARPATYTSSPSCCTQTTYRPVVMQAVHDQATCCNSCNSGGTVGQAIYQPSTPASCPSCATASHAAPLAGAGPTNAPSLPSHSPAPPSTFRREKPMTEAPATLDPIPAEESSFEEQNAGAWDAPLLLDPNDRLTKRPTAPVWAAVYKKSADTSQTTSGAAARSVSQSKQTIGWTSGR